MRRRCQRSASVISGCVSTWRRSTRLGFTRRISSSGGKQNSSVVSIPVPRPASTGLSGRRISGLSGSSFRQHRGKAYSTPIRQHHANQRAQPARGTVSESDRSAKCPTTWPRSTSWSPESPSAAADARASTSPRRSPQHHRYQADQTQHAPRPIHALVSAGFVSRKSVTCASGRIFSTCAVATFELVALSANRNIAPPRGSPAAAAGLLHRLPCDEYARPMPMPAVHAVRLAS